MKKVMLIIMLMSLALALNAEFSFYKPTPSWNPNFNLGGIFHPDKVKMNHTMSFASGVSSTGSGFYESAYTNHLRFDLRQNLKLNVDISVVNLGTMSHNNDLKFSGNNDNQNVIVPSFSLQYKPTENTTIHFEYRQVRGLGGGNNPYAPYHPYSSNNYSNPWWR